LGPKGHSHNSPSSFLPPRLIKKNYVSDLIIIETEFILLPQQEPQQIESVSTAMSSMGKPLINFLLRKSHFYKILGPVQDQCITLLDSSDGSSASFSIVDLVENGPQSKNSKPNLTSSKGEKSGREEARTGNEATLRISE
jgi:hypothetical protein